LIAVSRLAPNKRIDHGILMLAELRRGGMPAELTVVGDGIEAGRLRELTANLGLSDVVHFVGYRPENEKLGWLRESHVLIHPSVREGWGLNVIEGNAMGTPAAVYPVDGLVDSTVHQVTGCIASGETPEALAEAVRWLVGDHQRFARVREAAWRRSGEFRWTTVIPRVCEFLESMASGPKLV
jgi:glycosyltransferase involved in cell wall biosynthesis